MSRRLKKTAALGLDLAAPHAAPKPKPGSVQDATLENFPQRPTKDTMLSALLLILEDFGSVFDAVDSGEDDMILEDDQLLALARACRGADAVRGALGTIALLEARRKLHRLVTP